MRHSRPRRMVQDLIGASSDSGFTEIGPAAQKRSLLPASPPPLVSLHQPSVTDPPGSGTGVAVSGLNLSFRDLGSRQRQQLHAPRTSLSSAATTEN